MKYFSVIFLLLIESSAYFFIFQSLVEGFLGHRASEVMGGIVSHWNNSGVVGEIVSLF